MAKIWTTEDFNAAYTQYNHQWAVNSGFVLYASALQRLTDRSTYTPSAEVLFIGCGFGYWIEYLLTVPGVQASNVWGIDTGPHINANKNDPVYVNPTVQSKILNLDISSPSILNDLKPYFGGNGKVGGWVVSTLVLTSLETDQEISDFSSNCDALLGPSGEVAHIFTSEVFLSTDPDDFHNRTLGMNWQPRDYWSSRLSNHWLFDQHGWAHPEATLGDPSYIGRFGIDYFGVWNPNANGGVGGWE